jgi:hypothetical protein
LIIDTLEAPVPVLKIPAEVPGARCGQGRDD